MEGWGYDEATTKKYDALVEKAEELTKARKYKDAAEAWEFVINFYELNPNPRPVQSAPPE